MRSWHVVVLVMMGLSWWTGHTHAQTGSVNPSASQLAEVETFVAPEVTFIEETAVDLRHWLPAVGMQQMNDCTAWAIAYVAKTYAEARDQGWRPNHPSRIFSPTFIYNQINKGVDEGSTFVDAIVLMRDQGAATLATAPYLSRNHTRLPSDRARQEAAAFPIHDGYMVEGQTGIRRALQRRQVVVFGANVNPLFLGGRFQHELAYLYTRGHFVADHKNRRPNQPHGKHAMAVVGYDDAKGAFLVQNSWGPKWADRGYCWIAYDLFDQMSLTDSDDPDNPTFCNWAVTLVDVEEPIEIGPDGLPRSRPLDLSTLRVTGFSDFLRYDQDLKKFLYGFSVELRGQREAMKQIKQVTWRWIDFMGKQREHTADNTEARFGIRSSTTSNPMKIAADVHMQDGSVTTLEHEVRGPIPTADFRHAKILFDLRFYDFVLGTRKPMYWWEMGLDYPLNERQDIVKVTWDWGQMSTYDETSTTYEGKFIGVIADQRPVGFATQPDTVRVEITYADGGVKRLEHRPTFDAPIITKPEIEIDIKEIGRDHRGQMHYAFTLGIQRSRKMELDITRVVWELDPHVLPEAQPAHEAHLGWPLSGSSHRDFRAVATLEYADGRKQTLNRWIELGSESRFPDDNRVDLMAYDTFQQMKDGKPVWDVAYLLAGDRERVRQIAGVTWLHPEGASPREEVMDAASLARLHEQGHLIQRYDAGDSVEAAATVRFADGTTSSLKLAHKPQSIADESLGLQVSMTDEAIWFLDSDHPHTYLYEAQVVGPQSQLGQILQIDWYHQVRSRQERTPLAGNMLGVLAGLRLNSTLTEPFELMARVLFVDGFEQYLTMPVEPGVSGQHRPELSLQVREKFWRYHDTSRRPQWVAAMEIAGQAHRLGEIESVVYTLQAIDETEPRNPVTRLTNRPYWIAVSQPRQVTALVRLRDGSQVTLKGRIHAQAHRGEQPLHLRYVHTFAPQIRNMAYLVTVDGWEAIRQNIHKVTYQAGDFTDSREFASHIYPTNLPTLIPYTDKHPVTARVELHDGTVHQLEQAIKSPLLEVDWAWQQSNYWGDGLWEVEAWLTGPLPRLARLTREAWFPLDEQASAFKQMGSWPGHRHRAHLAPGVYRMGQPQYMADPGRDMAQLQARDILVENRILQRLEHLALHIAPGPVKPPTGDSHEWVIRLRGPERDLSQIRRVHYHWSSKPDQPLMHTTIDRRWGEFYDGFELRFFGESQPVVRATAFLHDGRLVTLAPTSHVISRKESLE